MGRKRFAVVVLGVLAAAQLATMAGTTPGGADVTPELYRYPYLTDLVDTRVTINWATDQSGTVGTATWGGPVAAGAACSPTQAVAATKSAINVNGVAEWQWKAKLTLPGPGTYCYRVQLAGADLLGTDPSPQFATQVPAGATTPFSFAVFGDWGLTNTSGDNADQANVMSQIASSGVRFALTTGDNGYPNGDQKNYGDLRQHAVDTSGVFGPSQWAVPGRSIPIFPATGNHGLSGSGPVGITNWPQDVAVSTSNGRYRVDTYCCVNGTTSANYASSWYAFDAGNARFYMLSATWGDGNVGTADVYANDKAAHWTPGAPEYDWLVNDLAAHPDGLKFAIFHYPLYSGQASQASDTYLQGPDSLEGLLAQHGVDMIFNGHAHIYQRNNASRPGYPVSYVTGGGGAALQSVRNCAAPAAYAIGWTATSCGSAPVPDSYTRVFHFLKVTVNGGQVTVTPTDELGRTFDVQTYTFGEPPPDTVFDSTPPATTPSTSAKFAFHATKPNATFRCQLDTDAPTACTSPLNLSRLAGGVHRLTVAATSIWGTDPTPADFTWRVGNATPSAAGFVVDGFGGLHPVTVGNAPVATPHDGPYWPGWNIARGVALMPDGSGGYVLDAFGGLHPFAIGSSSAPPATRDGPYWAGWDVAKGLAIAPDGTGGYIIDAWGGLHQFAIGNGTAPPHPTDAAYWQGWSVARGVAVLPSGSGYTVDAWGGLHPFSVNGATPPKPSGGPYWPNLDIVRGVTTMPDGSAGYIVDGFGGVHGFRVLADASEPATSGYWYGWDIVRGVGL
jgi:hypothetical protein